MKYIIALFLAIPMFAWATTIDISKLPPDQRAAIEKQVADASAPANISQTVRTEAAAWGQLGTNIGYALIGAAREVGMAANEFASTDLGKVVTFVVVYKIIGESLVGVGFGLIVFIIGFSISVHMIRRKVVKSVTYDNVPTFFGLMTKRKIASETRDADDETGYVVGGLAVLLITVIISAVMVF